MKRATLTLLALAAALTLQAQVRVTFVGASITEGAGTARPAAESYPAQAQALLGDAWHIENYGVSSCTMLRHGDFPYWTKGRLGEALASRPDIVFIDLGGNDSKPQNAAFIDKEFADDAESLVRASDVPWGRKEGGFMWAPDAAYRNGKYYFYFPHPSGTHTGSTWKIGVATSDKPASDFKVGGYIKGMTSYYDPCVFVDDDGQAYIYNGGGGRCFGARLKKNMTQLAGKMVPMEGLEDFHEGPWVHKYNGKYYLSYPDNYIDANGKQYNRMHYAMSDSPLGPWEYKGIFLDATDCDTTHGSVVEFQGQWYLFYHGCQLSQMGNLRSICVDRLYYNEDGTIRKVHQRHHSYLPRK